MLMLFLLMMLLMVLMWGDGVLRVVLWFLDDDDVLAVGGCDRVMKGKGDG